MAPMPPDVVSDAATLQKSRSQDFTSALIRGGSLQLQQPEKPPARLLSGERAPPLPAVELSFHPQICKPGRLEAGYSEHLRERVAQSRLLDDELKADCLERLVGVAQRAPRVRRLSWSQQIAEEEVPESDEEVIEITKEDLLKEDPPEELPVHPEPEPGQTAEAEPDAEEAASSKGFDPSRRSVMEAELREVLTPTPELLERAQRAQVASSSHSERHSLGNLLAQNQHLAARAGLSSWGDCTWRPTGPEENSGAAQSGRRGVPRSSSKRGADAAEVDFYSGWQRSWRSSPHWHFRSSSPRYGGFPAVSTQSSRRIPPTLRPSGDLDAEPCPEPYAEPSVEALPISSEAVEETRQAVLGAKQLVTAGATVAFPRGVGSLLRHALRMVAESS